VVEHDEGGVKVVVKAPIEDMVPWVIEKQAREADAVVHEQ